MKGTANSLRQGQPNHKEREAMKKLLTKAIDTTLLYFKSRYKEKLKGLREAWDLIEIRRRVIKGEAGLLVDGKIDFEKYRERKLMESKLRSNRMEREFET